MPLFDQIGKRLTGMGQNISQQAKNFAETSRMNSEIDEMERKISRLYAEIGEAYYGRHKDDAEPEEAGKIKEINSLFAHISRLQEEVKQIKGVTKCPECGADVPAEALFCSSCGAQIVLKSEPEPNVAEIDEEYCPQCGRVIREGNTFCTYCGARLTPSAAAINEREGTADTDTNESEVTSYE